MSVVGAIAIEAIEKNPEVNKKSKDKYSTNETPEESNVDILPETARLDMTQVSRLLASSPDLLQLDLRTQVPSKLRAILRLLPDLAFVSAASVINTYSVKQLETFDKLITPTSSGLGEFLIKYPAILLIDEKVGLKQKIDELRQVLPQVNLTTLLIKEPRLLSHSVSSHLIPRMNYLFSMLQPLASKSTEKPESSPITPYSILQLLSTNPTLFELRWSRYQRLSALRESPMNKDGSDNLLYQEVWSWFNNRLQEQYQHAVKVSHDSSIPQPEKVNDPSLVPHDLLIEFMTMTVTDFSAHFPHYLPPTDVDGKTKKNVSESKADTRKDDSEFERLELEDDVSNPSQAYGPVATPGKNQSVAAALGLEDPAQMALQRAQTYRALKAEREKEKEAKENAKKESETNKSGQFDNKRNIRDERETSSRGSFSNRERVGERYDDDNSSRKFNKFESGRDIQRSAFSFESNPASERSVNSPFTNNSNRRAKNASESNEFRDRRGQNYKSSSSFVDSDADWYMQRAKELKTSNSTNETANTSSSSSSVPSSQPSTPEQGTPAPPANSSSPAKPSSAFLANHRALSSLSQQRTNAFTGRSYSRDNDGYSSKEEAPPRRMREERERYTPSRPQITEDAFTDTPRYERSSVGSAASDSNSNMTRRNLRNRAGTVELNKHRAHNPGVEEKPTKK